MIAAIIPARGGSKRIPGKNIRPFCGKPIIAWSIEAARQSGLFDHIIVSTDDEKIAGVARAHGADTPFMRPAGLSGDMTATMPVVHHAVEWIEANIGPLDYACCLYATAPLASGETLRRGFEAMKQAGADFAMSVTSFPFPIQRALRITPEGRLQPFDPASLMARSQDLEAAWHDAGQFYWGTPAAFGDPLQDLIARAVPVRLPRHLVQDIDTPEDWIRAEYMFRAIHGIQ
ncbi:MAG: pseudaminic acid cytidylyltransferase [Alphaproteobacteria bacterium HGW-Alphaproteobacteria-12]|nr:MAG: pseudaminic acid cytidylyltransferase [Alphaproteobacteria bacterium HGW-Alphaproteobacteria-12]